MALYLLGLEMEILKPRDKGHYGASGLSEAKHCWHNSQEVPFLEDTVEFSVIDCFENSGKFRTSSLLQKMEWAIFLTGK